ncbi:MAG: tRNA lysidine(34) synthetase TilS [Phycisphaerales bacterium]|nr:tRNA lysidine(34) synthetase TilS [Phycisphaerales bacterium]
MHDAASKPGGPARHAVAARIVRSWRELTGRTGRGKVGPAGSTLLACSGGADSSALVLAMAGLGPAMVVAHVVHDLRPAAAARADRDAVAELAARSGLRMVEARVRVRGRGGNAEGVARRLRYAALARLAVKEGCVFVATAHHADDQLETVLMRLMRGAGPAGLGGIAPRRRLAPGVELVRPMLGVTREEAEGLCRARGWEWREDATNQDESRVRAKLRKRVLPVLREIRPDAAARAARSVELMRAAARVVEARAAELLRSAAQDEEGRLLWARDALRKEPEVVVGAVLRAAARRLGRGVGMDRAGRGVVERAARAVRDGVGGRRELRIGRARVWVKSGEVIAEKVEDE